MSEAMTVPPLNETEAKRTPTVYFIDDSATMREVIKIAFRRESINVITCADAASALAQFEQNKPDVVITDVIMPDQDGYSVCSQIKQHPEYGGVPVVLMSGVVNKSVADKAVAVKADELIRKPFQPQELIGRVKSLLEPKRAAGCAACGTPGDAKRAKQFICTAASACGSTAHGSAAYRRRPARSGIHLASRACRSVHRTTPWGWRGFSTEFAASRIALGQARSDRVQTYKSCVQKSLGSIFSSRNCRLRCRSSGNTRRRWSSRSKRLHAWIRSEQRRDPFVCLVDS